MMNLTEELINSVTKQVCGGTQINYQGTEINLRQVGARPHARLVEATA